MIKKPTSIRWRILLILVLASFISYFLRSNMSIAAPAMISELSLTEIEWGWILAAFTAGYALFQFPGGILGDKFGPRRVLATIAVLWALLTFATSLVPGPESGSTMLIIGSLIAVRFLVGAVHAPIFPVMNSSIVRWFPVGGWALPLGLSSTGLTLGAAAGTVALAWMITGFGWRLSFIVIAPLGLLVAVLWWWYARDNPADHPSVNEQEVELINAGRTHAGEGAGEEGLADWLRVLKNRDVLLLTLSYSSMNFVFYIVFNWFFYYLVEVRQFSATDASFVSSSQWIAGAAGAALGGWLCDRMCKRFGLRWGCRWPVVIGMVVSAALLFVGAFHPNQNVAVAMLVMCFFFNQLNEGPYWASSIAIGGKQAGAAGGVMNTGANVMGVVNALLVPFFAATFGWTFAISSGAIFALIGAGLMLLVRADQPLDTAHQGEFI
jgi:ACS family glucarate transporter-like MFS transporter